MALFSQEDYNHHDVVIADFFRILALPVRVSILKVMLNSNDWVSDSEFYLLPLMPKSIDKHLLAMKSEKLIIREKRCGESFYKLNLENLAAITINFEHFNKQLIHTINTQIPEINHVSK
nr:helix-turn-helix transcriptional regulator [uncultured Mucilaginibacter sp.]